MSSSGIAAKPSVRASVPCTAAAQPPFSAAACYRDHSTAKAADGGLCCSMWVTRTQLAEGAFVCGRRAAPGFAPARHQAQVHVMLEAQQRRELRPTAAWAALLAEAAPPGHLWRSPGLEHLHPVLLQPLLGWLRLAQRLLRQWLLTHAWLHPQRPQ